MRRACWRRCARTIAWSGAEEKAVRSNIHIAGGVTDAGDRVAQAEFASIVRYFGRVFAIDMEIAERLVGFREQTLHLRAKVVGEVIIPLLEHGLAYGGEPLFGFRIVAVDGHAGPERVFVELKSFFGGIDGRAQRRP